MKSKTVKYATIALSLLLLAAGLFLVKTTVDPQGIMASLPYVAIGIGARHE